MAFFSHLGKDASRFQFDILIHEVSGPIPISDLSTSFYCTCERGSKRFRTDLAAPVHGIIRWNKVLSFGCTLYKAKNTFAYQKKSFVFRVKSTERVKSTKRFGKASRVVNLCTNVNLSAFASKGVRHATLNFPLVTKPGEIPKTGKDKPPELRLTVRCRWVNDMSKDSSGYSSCSSDGSRSDLAISEPDLGGIWQPDSIAGGSVGSGDHDNGERGIIDEEKRLERKLRIGFMLRGEHAEALERQAKTAAARGLRPSMDGTMTNGNGNATSGADLNRSIVITVPDAIMDGSLSSMSSSSVTSTSGNGNGNGLLHPPSNGHRERRATPPNGFVTPFTVRQRLSVGDRKPVATNTMMGNGSNGIVHGHISAAALALDAGAVPPSNLSPLITDDNDHHMMMMNNGSSSISSTMPSASSSSLSSSPIIGDPVSQWLRELNLQGLGLPLMSRDGAIERNTERDIWLLNNSSYGRTPSLSVGSGTDSLAPVHSLSPSHHSSSISPATPRAAVAVAVAAAATASMGMTATSASASVQMATPIGPVTSRRPAFNYDEDPDLPDMSPAVQLALAEHHNGSAAMFTSSTSFATSSSTGNGNGNGVTEPAANLLAEFARFSPDDLQRLTNDNPAMAQQLLLKLQQLQRMSSNSSSSSVPSSSPLAAASSSSSSSSMAFYPPSHYAPIPPSSPSSASHISHISNLPASAHLSSSSMSSTSAVALSLQSSSSAPLPLLSPAHIHHSNNHIAIHNIPTITMMTTPSSNGSSPLLSSLSSPQSSSMFQSSLSLSSMSSLSSFASTSSTSPLLSSSSLTVPVSSSISSSIMSSSSSSSVSSLSQLASPSPEMLALARHISADQANRRARGISDAGANSMTIPSSAAAVAAAALSMPSFQRSQTGGGQAYTTRRRDDYNASALDDDDDNSDDDVSSNGTSMFADDMILPSSSSNHHTHHHHHHHNSVADRRAQMAASANAKLRKQRRRARLLDGVAMSALGGISHTANGTPLHFIKYASFTDVTPFEEGHFGMVFRAIWRHTNGHSNGNGNGIAVVIKVPKKRPGNDEWSELFSFLDLPRHHNVLPFLGVCRDFKGLKYSAFCLVTELQRGPLKETLTRLPSLPKRCHALHQHDANNRIINTITPSPSPPSVPSLQSSAPSTMASDSTNNDCGVPVYILRILWDMAEGLAHLHEHGIVHRDIALRNFLVSDDYRVLICDFGMSRMVDDDRSSYYQIDHQSALPIRWMAPEALLTHKFTRMSDVWMYGVACWEVLTHGNERPYDSVDTFSQVICGVCIGTLQLPLSCYCSGPLLSLLSSCFDLNPERRPTMSMIARHLQRLFNAAITNNYNGHINGITSGGSMDIPIPAALEPLCLPPPVPILPISTAHASLSLSSQLALAASPSFSSSSSVMASYESKDALSPPASSPSIPIHASSSIPSSSSSSIMVLASGGNGNAIPQTNNHIDNGDGDRHDHAHAHGDGDGVGGGGVGSLEVVSRALLAH